MNPLEESGLRGDMSLKARIGRPVRNLTSPLVTRLNRATDRLQGRWGMLLETGATPEEVFSAMPK